MTLPTHHGIGQWSAKVEFNGELYALTCIATINLDKLVFIDSKAGKVIACKIEKYDLLDI